MFAVTNLLTKQKLIDLFVRNDMTHYKTERLFVGI